MQRHEVEQELEGLYLEIDSFRDRPPTVDEKGRRVWLYPKEPKGGRFWKIRKLLSYFQLLILFGLPFLSIKGQPAVLLNILERKAIFFGQVFWPEDLYLFILFFLSLVVLLLLLTATVGRVFCGWACPQTVFLELVFRRIERWIEGDGPKQKKLDQAPWSREKFFKKVLKHSIFFLLSFAIGNLFLAYIVGKDTLFSWMSQPPWEHPYAFFAVFFFSLLFYGIFSRFREQACVAVCPYGRLQSVLQDENTIMVTYDYKRGEPRGKGVKNRSPEMGDCIDCKQCIAVCPTGIDIRNGVQMECINCTACIDACDMVMKKIHKEPGLIRYTSQTFLETGRHNLPNPRIVGYAILFVALFSTATWLYLKSPSAHGMITRAHGILFQEIEDKISNAYRYQILNKTLDPRQYTFRLLHPKGELQLGEEKISVPPQGIVKGTFLVLLPKKHIFFAKNYIQVGLFEKDTLQETFTLTFLAPEKKP